MSVLAHTCNGLHLAMQVLANHRNATQVAVSDKKKLKTNQTWPSVVVNSVSIASRVVPLIGLTIVLSSPTNAFRMLLLPTFGRPTMAIAGTYSCSSS